MMTTLSPPTLPAAPALSDPLDSRRRLLIFGGLAGVAAGLAFFAASAMPWDHDLPVELARWQSVLVFWTILAVAPFAIAFAYAVYRLIAWERESALNQLGFVFAVVAFSILAVTQSFQNAVPLVLTDEMKAEGSGPEAWDRIYAGLNALDLGTDLAWDLFLGLWLLCIGVAMFRHSLLGARWAVPALALVPPFFAFNMAATPDPPVVDLGPVIGMYSTALSAWLVWLGTRRIEPVVPRNKEDPMIRNMGSFDRGVRAVVVAPVAIVLAFSVGASTFAGVILFVLAGIMLATSATGFCPNYIWLGITTYPRSVHRVGHHIRQRHA